MENWEEPWRTISLLDLVKEIGGGEQNYRNHPVYKEWEYQIQNRGSGNDLGNLEWVGNNEKTPIINEYLLNNGYENDEMVMFWVCW